MKPAAGAIISTSEGTRSNPDSVAGSFIATRSSGLHLPFNAELGSKVDIPRDLRPGAARHRPYLL